MYWTFLYHRFIKLHDFIIDILANQKRSYRLDIFGYEIQASDNVEFLDGSSKFLFDSEDKFIETYFFASHNVVKIVNILDFPSLGNSVYFIDTDINRMIDRKRLFPE